MSDFYHVSVMLDECIEGLNIRPNGIYVDGTLGGAGHSSQIAKRLATGRLIGIDRDPVALKAAGERLAPYSERVTLVRSNFVHMDRVLADLGIDGVDGILLDIGVSSHQLDAPERGFSYHHDAPLDMRMSQSGTSAADLVATLDEKQLADIFFRYGRRSSPAPLPAPLCGNGKRLPSKPPCSWRTSSAAACRRRHGGTATPRAACFRPCASPSTVSWTACLRRWIPPSIACG